MGGKHREPSWWRRWRERQQARRRLVSPMVDGDGNEHLVTHIAYEQGLSEGSGFCLAVCGQRIAVGGMAALPTRYYCPRCGVLEPQP